MATKTFEIEINGISLSVSAVDALLAKLDALDNRIDSLSDVDTANLKSSLLDIRKELETNADNWEDISDRIEDVTLDINTLERSYKALDNPFKVQDIRQYNKEIEEVSESIKLVELNADRIDGLGDFHTDLDRASASAKDLASNLQKVQRAEDLLGTKLNINIGGLSLEFDDVNQAIGVLEDKLYLLANSGLRNSQQFKDITALIVNLRTAVKQVDNELDNAFSGGLNKAIQGVQGLTAIGSVASGIGGLFGVEELDESILKFAQLSLILLGLKEVQELLKDSTSFLSLAFLKINEAVTSTTTFFGKLAKVLDSIVLGGAFSKLGGSLDKLGDKLGNKFKNLSKSLQLQDLLYQINSLTKIDYADTIYALEDLEIALKKVFGEDYEHPFKDLLKDYGDTSKLLSELEADLEDGLISEEQFNKATEAIKEFEKEIAVETKKAAELRKQYYDLKGDDIFIGRELGETVPQLTNMQKGFVLLAKGITAAASAFKAFAKSTLILIAVLKAIEAVTWVWDKLVSGFRAFTGANLAEMVSPFEDTQASIEATNKSIDKYKKNLLNLVDNKVISNQTRLNNTIDEYNRLLELTIKNLLRLKEGQALSFDTNNTWFTGADIQNMEDFIKQFEILLKAVQSGTDRFKALEGETEEVKKKFSGNWFLKLWNDAGDAASDYAAALKAVIGDIQYRINNLDLSKGEEEIKKFLDLLDTPIYQISLANVEKLFPEDEYAKVLAANIQLIRDYYDEIQNLLKEAEENALALQDLITDNNIAAILNRYDRERAELENNYLRELRDAENNEELKQSIINKYNTLRALMARQHGNEVRNIQNQINSNEIAAMLDGLAKRLAELELSRKQELDAARESGIKVAEQEAAINKKYDAQVLEVKAEFYDNRKKLLEDYSNQYKLLWDEIADIEAEIATSRVNIKAEDLIDALGYNEEGLDAVRGYYNQVRDIANQQAKKLSEINKEHAQVSTDLVLEDEKKRNKERLEVIELNYKDELLTKEEYDKAIQDENDLHLKRIEVITKQGEQRLIEIQREYDEAAKNNNITAINERIAAINEAYDDIDVEAKASKLGIIDYAETKKELEKAKDEFTKILNEIAKERDELQKAFDNKEISFNDFRQAKKELDSLEKDVVTAQMEIGMQLESLLNIVIDSIGNYVGQYITVLNDMWSTYNDIQMMRFEQEQARLEEEYDMLEEAYSKQEELTQKHTDKLNEIEDELKTSRGDRRAHLVEQLNAEREAQLASLQEEQRIEKQKEINQKKQDALEKKRREQEKKNSIVQATINTFTAVTNALAVQPWFVGLALSAVALALGMAQVANIKKQKYASGGLLKGKSHNLGGIPVGNTGIEVEGEEYVINKNSTKKNLPLIDYINNSNKKLTKDDLVNWYDSGKKNVISQTKNKFATGGVIPTLPNTQQEQTIVITDDRPIVALIVDIVNSADNYRQIQVLSGLSGKTI